MSSRPSYIHTRVRYIDSDYLHIYRHTLPPDISLTFTYVQRPRNTKRFFLLLISELYSLEMNLLVFNLPDMQEYLWTMVNIYFIDVFQGITQKLLNLRKCTAKIGKAD